MSPATVSPDSQVILLLCTQLALARRDSELKPLSRSEWNDVARAIDASSFKRPAALLGAAAASLAVDLNITPVLAERISALLARGGQLAIELERLATLGIWPLTRGDALYPPRLKERLKGHAPPVIFGAGPAETLNHRGIAIVGSRDVDAHGSAFASELGALCAIARDRVLRRRSWRRQACGGWRARAPRPGRRRACRQPAGVAATQGTA